VPTAGVFASACELLAGLRAGRLSSEELVTAAITRAREVNPRLNAVVALDEAGALTRARVADRTARAGEATGRLHGLPMTVKDCFEVAGLPAVNGAAELRDHRPRRHALAVQRLVDAGAIIIGKTNTPLYSLDLQTFNEVYGVTRNPWDSDRTPGGSSGGAAVALATGITSLEIGTDLAGSLRIPAHASGVCSLKPSFGLVPTAGVLSTVPGRLRAADLVVAGPMARTVADLQLLFGLLAGTGGRDAAAWRLELPPPRAPGKALRVAAWLDEATCPVAPAVAGVLESACRRLAGAGVAVDTGARPAFVPAEYFQTFLRLMYGEMSAGFPESIFRAFAAAARRHAGDDAWTPLTVMPGAVAQSHRDWLAASEQRERYRAAWDDFFARWDVLIAPVAPTTALAHDYRPFEERTISLGGREYAYMQQSFWCGLATLAYLPAAVVPVGLAADGLPVGLQIIGPYLGDETVLEFAGLVEKALGGFRRPPG
jgi:amidase